MNHTQEILHTGSVNLLLIDKWLCEGRIALEEVGEMMPFVFHLDNTDLSIQYLNPEGCQQLNLSLSEARSLKSTFVTKYYHSSCHHVRHDLSQFYDKNDYFRSYSNIIKMLDPDTAEYKATLLTAKRSRLHDGFYVTTESMDKVSYSSKKLQRMMGEEQFVKKRYEVFASLTEREREVLTLLALGHNNPSIADYLFISRKTVEQHRKNINKKLNSNSFVTLMKYAQAFDLV
ncbi:helix-turn-helix transcriptional regulator [Fulvivirga maritima]|uniref:response regulator transcription factor n=1 Tax=Fulvivirga maritima TaxID=2904247 RepID=UPI001F288851|nr:helix-turn-helix transcriptional regulator [Fulvivirga maritima]UII26096.1 helix-turn-helix transcriptional regulator [Fulvivirga maritima]